MFLLRTALAFSLCLPALNAQQFSLEQILSAPFPTELTASPRGDAITWVVVEKGIRNVWIARAPDFKAAAITHFTADDGQEISDPTWKRDSSAVYFTRGGDPNSRGEFPNPTSDPAGVRQEIWIAPVSGTAHKVGDGHGPAVPPDNSGVAWVLGGQIWWAGVDSKPIQLTHARGSAEELAWSPVGLKLAFRSARSDHAFIGLYDHTTKTLQYIDASADRDQSPEWSPDGKQIAFIRLPASRYAFMHGAKRTGDPWSIRIADIGTGQGREVWRAQEGMGSVFWPVSARNQLLWSQSGQIIFPWEREGWLHLYSLVAESGGLMAITRGNYEVEHASLSHDGRSVIYSSNENDIDRRHIWQVPAGGGSRSPLTPGSSLEWRPAPLADGLLAVFHSDQRPARTALLSAGSIRDLAPDSRPAEFPAPVSVLFNAPDGTQIHGQLFQPLNNPTTKHPAVIFIHGGSRRQMLLGWHSMFYYHQAYAFNQFLASKGFVVLSVNYRSGTGYGEAFREALNYGPTGASEYQDILAAGLYLKSRPDVIPSKIGLWGGSYGGYLTALALARNSDVFAAGVDLHGVHDWNLEISNFIPLYEPEKRLDIAKVAYRSSPMSSVSTWKSPVLLIHGDDDRNVPFSETVQLTEELRKYRVPFEQIVFPDEIHDFLLHKNWVRAYAASYDFLQQQLQQ